MTNRILVRKIRTQEVYVYCFDEKTTTQNVEKKFDHALVLPLISI